MMENSAARKPAPRRSILDRTHTAAIADYQRLCMPLYNPPGRIPSGGPRSSAPSCASSAAPFHPGEIRTMDARAGLAKITCPT